ncbi:MAG: hypothetical protein QOD96_1469, partial [Pseudonocardiales bacterium]|nr:hypothetical protein [Pseudonocardiales bacterium]
MTVEPDPADQPANRAEEQLNSSPAQLPDPAASPTPGDSTNSDPVTPGPAGPKLPEPGPVEVAVPASASRPAS